MQAARESLLLHPFCCASTIALVHTTTPRGAWWNSCEPFLVKNADHAGSSGESSAPPLLLRFNNCPGAHNNAARCLVEQLRALPGEKRRSCRQLGRVFCSTPFVALQQLPWCTQQRRAVPGGTAASPSW